MANWRGLQRRLQELRYKHAVRRYEYFDNHQVEWLRILAQQLSVVNSVGTTASFALVQPSEGVAYIVSGFVFLAGLLCAMYATYLAHSGNRAYAEEMRSRLDAIVEIWHDEEAIEASARLNDDLKAGETEHQCGECFARISFISAILGAGLLIYLLITGS